MEKSGIGSRAGSGFPSLWECKAAATRKPCFSNNDMLFPGIGSAGPCGGFQVEREPGISPLLAWGPARSSRPLRHTPASAGPQARARRVSVIPHFGESKPSFILRDRLLSETWRAAREFEGFRCASGCSTSSANVLGG